MSSHPIAIDMTGQHLYAAQLKSVRQGFSIRGLFHRKMEGDAAGDSGAAEAWVPVFQEIRKERSFVGRRVVMHLPPPSVFRFPVRVQIGEGETLEEAILRESRQYIPFPLEEAVLDYPSLVSLSTRDGDFSKAMIVAARREEIQGCTVALEQAGLILEAVDLGLCSLIRLHRAVCGTGQGAWLLCNIGEETTLLAAVTADSILAQRDIPWGMQTLVQKIRSGFGIKGPEPSAESILQEYGFLYEDRDRWKEATAAAPDSRAENACRAIYQILSPCTDELVHELHKIIGYVRSEESNAALECVYLYGHAGLIRSLDHHLEKRLSLATQLVNPLSALVLSEKSVPADRFQAAPFGLALGLAMRKVSWL